MHSVELYRALGAEVDLDTGWREVGSLRLASSRPHLEELERQSAWAETFGLPLQMVSAAEAGELFPPMATDGVLGAAFLPTDGYLDPSQLTLALAKGARQRGAKIVTGRRVVGIDVRGGRVRAVETDAGPIECEVVVNAGGIYAHEIGRLAGVDVPARGHGAPVRHHQAVRAAPRHADAARPGPVGLLPGRERRAGGGGLRAQPRTVGARGDPGRLQPLASWSRTGTGSLRFSRRPTRACRACRRRDRDVDQRPRGFHPRRRVHPRASPT